MNGFLRLFEQRIRGIRLIELIGLVLALGMIFWVCLSKAREGEDIRRMNELDAQIAQEKDSVQGLRIKVAQLEKPSRLEALAKQYLGMEPVSAAHEARLDALGEISHTSSRPIVPTDAASGVAAPVTAAATATPPPVVAQPELITTVDRPAPGGH